MTADAGNHHERALLVGTLLGLVWSALAASATDVFAFPIVWTSIVVASWALPAPARWSAPHQRVLAGAGFALLVGVLVTSFVVLVGIAFGAMGAVDWEALGQILGTLPELLLHVAPLAIVLPAAVLHVELIYRLDRAARRRAADAGSW